MSTERKIYTLSEADFVELEIAFADPNVDMEFMNLLWGRIAYNAGVDINSIEPVNGDRTKHSLKFYAEPIPNTERN